MKVLLFHPVRLPPKDYGGVERVVLWLAKGLKELGHEVRVAALEGSKLPEGVQLVPVRPGQAPGSDFIKGQMTGVDVVHFMAPPGEEVWARTPCARILTVHGNGRAGEVYPLNSVFLSADHARRHGAQAFVHNGLDPSEFRFEPRAKKDWFLFLSKTSWSVKNLAGALRICRRAGAGLRVAGGRRPLGLRLQAMLTPGVRWEGPVSGERKAELLAQARALVFPVVWPEPFGLVVAEALVSGTPVLASRMGSLPELVPEDVGALFDSQSEGGWVEALRNGRWDPERCRAWALEKFHYQKMAESYLALYRRVSGGQTLHSSEPRGTDWRAELRRDMNRVP